MSTDPGTERRDVQLLLRIGLGAAAALMAAGVIAAVASGPAPTPGLDVRALWHGSLGWPMRLCGLGVVVLSATPAFRVVTLVVLWVRERDWKYVAVALTVVTVLLLALALGGG